MDEKTKMLSGELYRADDAALRKAYAQTRNALERFNATHYNDFEIRKTITAEDKQFWHQKQAAYDKALRR